jgi:ubiquitin carboxyl-terminal hydrolase 2/21
LQRGELLDAFKRLVREVYGRRKGSVDPVDLVKRLGALGAALGEDFTDGGQHDCEEVLSAIMDRLHEDLNRVEPPEEPEQGPEAGAAPPATPEPAQQQHGDGPGAGEPATPPTPQTPNLNRPSHRLAMAGGLGRDSAQLSFGLRTLSLSSSAADHDGEEAAHGAPAPAQPEEKDDPNESQNAKADRLWKRYLEQDDSPVTDFFGGQLQNNVTCHVCKHRFTSYEFFKGLSLPLVREARSGLSSWFSAGKAPSSITDCLAAFTADETLQGDKNEYYSCDECKGRTAATINMRIHRFPRILMLHIKRFTYTGTVREKLTTNVAFPLKGLRLGAFASEEAGVGGDKDGGPEYDLYAVINHTGTMAGGHYVATCRAAGTKDQWYTFNDEVVVKTQASSVATANAYILFYVRRNA